MISMCRVLGESETSVSSDRQQIVAFLVEHYEHPRNREPLPDADIHEASGNTECGDYVEMYATVGAGGRLERVTFQGNGSTIGLAAASYVTERLQGMTLAEVEGFGQETLLDELGREVVGSSRMPATLALVTLQRGVRQWRLRHDSEG
jgi:nitrogen fixation NifU-like protein